MAVYEGSLTTRQRDTAWGTGDGAWGGVQYPFRFMSPDVDSSEHIKRHESVQQGSQRSIIGGYTEGRMGGEREGERKTGRQGDRERKVDTQIHTEEKRDQGRECSLAPFQ